MGKSEESKREEAGRKETYFFTLPSPFPFFSYFFSPGFQLPPPPKATKVFFHIFLLIASSFSMRKRLKEKRESLWDQVSFDLIGKLFELS